ncbi:MAG: DUF2256 domain-containing protein [Rhodospirillales bacterium]|nr:DUF2256 domain-containing protein [Rhodospirillales bacterium]
MRGKRVAKADLPVKICAVCQRPFAWRKKWSKVWEEVRYCSDACRRRGEGALTAVNYESAQSLK